MAPPPSASPLPPSAAPRVSPTGVVHAVASRTVLAVGPTLAALAEPCLAIAREGVLLAFSAGDASPDSGAPWRLAARLAAQGAVALPLWPHLPGAPDEPAAAPESAAEALVARVAEEFGRLDGVLAVAGPTAASIPPADALLASLLRAASHRLGRGEPRVAGRFVVVWRGADDGLTAALHSLERALAEGSWPGRGRHWTLDGLPWPTTAAEAEKAGRILAGYLAPTRTAASVPEGPRGR